MFFYFVWVRSSHYHGQEALTYASKKHLKTGTIVRVPLQHESVLGVVTGSTSQPRFKTKEIEEAFDLPQLPASLLKVGSWLQYYYPAPLGVITQQLLPAALPAKLLNREEPADFPAPKEITKTKLTKDQSNALDLIETSGSYLLHGITGSGKTRLYTELAIKSVADGKSVVILTPEISLTSQLAINFRSVFGDRVIVIHSRQTQNERIKSWLMCLTSSEPLVVIGPRSALFSPLQKIGLIVLDEAHEAAYKQEQAPQYQTGRVAAYLANLSRAVLLLGSATPSVTDYYLAKEKGRPIIELKQLAQINTIPKNKVLIVDHKKHELFNRSPFLSQPLLESIEQSLGLKRQSLLYLNRRGTARLIMCENCGWQANCPHCDLPLTYHGDTHTLRCHSCNYVTAALASCPACGHPSILFKTAGTKAIVEDVQRLFPHATVARFDTDNLKSERFEQHYEAVYAGKVDILVGTQLLAKGLDLPLLSTLGVILADTSLYMPDFSAQERTFQLLSQVLGRIGRGHVAGNAVIQTYHPEHPILESALNADYASFYVAELAIRKQFFFPPYCFLLKLSVRRASAANAESAAAKLKHDIEHSGTRVMVEGPAPCFYERFQKKYQWQLVVKAVERSELIKIIRSLPANWSYDIDPVDLL
jgi:primosomal protein N' (replication factor Y)